MLLTASVCDAGIDSLSVWNGGCATGIVKEVKGTRTSELENVSMSKEVVCQRAMSMSLSLSLSMSPNFCDLHTFALDLRK